MNTHMYEHTFIPSLTLMVTPTRREDWLIYLSEKTNNVRSTSSLIHWPQPVTWDHSRPRCCFWQCLLTYTVVDDATSISNHDTKSKSKPMHSKPGHMMSIHAEVKRRVNCQSTLKPSQRKNRSNTGRTLHAQHLKVHRLGLRCSAHPRETPSPATISYKHLSLSLSLAFSFTFTCIH